MSEKPARNEDWSIRQNIPRPSLSYYSDVEAQLLDRIGFPDLEPHNTLPGAFPTEAVIEAVVAAAPADLSADVAVEGSVPVPDAQTLALLGWAPPNINDTIEVLTADETGQSPVPVLNVQILVSSEASPSNNDNTIAPTDRSNITVNGGNVLGTLRPSISSWESMPLVENNETARLPSPDWVPAPSQTRLSNASIAVEPASRPEVLLDYDQELIDSIDKFRFSHMVPTHALSLNKKRDFRAMVDMTCNNLFNAGWDLTRLHMIWCDIILDAPSVEVLKSVEPWKRFSKEHIAKVCAHALQAISTYSNWAKQVKYCRAVPVTRDTTGDEFWKSFDAKLLDFDGLRLDSITSQVELVMEQYLDIEKKIATPNAASEQEGTSPAMTPACALLLEDVGPVFIAQVLEEHTANEPEHVYTPPTMDYTTSSSSKKVRHPAAIPQEKQESSEVSQGGLSNVERLPSSPAAQGPSLLQKPTSKSVPGFAQPTKTSLRAGQQSITTGNRTSKVAVNPVTARVPDVRSPPALMMPLKIQQRMKPAASSGWAPTKKVDIGSRPATLSSCSKFRIKCQQSPVGSTTRSLRSDSVHDQKVASTLPRNFCPPNIWPTSPPVFETTTIPLRVNGLGAKTIQFARPQLGDAAQRKRAASPDGAHVRASHQQMRRNNGGQRHGEESQVSNGERSKLYAISGDVEAVNGGNIEMHEKERFVTACEKWDTVGRVNESRRSRRTEAWFDASEVAVVDDEC
jgi:hypothetical protein